MDCIGHNKTSYDIFFQFVFTPFCKYDEKRSMELFYTLHKVS